MAANLELQFCFDLRGAHVARIPAFDPGRLRFSNRRPDIETDATRVRRSYLIRHRAMLTALAAGTATTRKITTRPHRESLSARRFPGCLIRVFISLDEPCPRTSLNPPAEEP